MKILDALKEKFNAKGTNIAEAIENIDKTFIASGEPDDGAVPTYNEETKDVEWAVPDEPTSELPSVTSADNNKILKVVNGAWDKGDAPSGGDTQLIVNATYNTETGEHFTFVECDKTVDQIIGAYKNGKDIVMFADIRTTGDMREYKYCVTLRDSIYQYIELDGGEGLEMLVLHSAVLLHNNDKSTSTYQITVGGANISLDSIQLTGPQQSS